MNAIRRQDCAAWRHRHPDATPPGHRWVITLWFRPRGWRSIGWSRRRGVCPLALPSLLVVPKGLSSMDSRSGQTRSSCVGKGGGGGGAPCPHWKQKIGVFLLPRIRSHQKRCRQCLTLPDFFEMCCTHSASGAAPSSGGDGGAPSSPPTFCRLASSPAPPATGPCSAGRFSPTCAPSPSILSSPSRGQTAPRPLSQSFCPVIQPTIRSYSSTALEGGSGRLPYPQTPRGATRNLCKKKHCLPRQFRWGVVGRPRETLLASGWRGPQCRPAWKRLRTRPQGREIEGPRGGVLEIWLLGGGGHLKSAKFSRRANCCRLFNRAVSVWSLRRGGRKSAFFSGEVAISAT